MAARKDGQTFLLVKTMYCVYKHITPNSKVYIGITSQIPRKRWKGGKSGYVDNDYFTKAIQKYGWENIRHEILFDGLTKEEAEQKEIELIAQYKSNQREYGYNIENGGSVSGKHSEETRKRMSEAQKGEKNHRYGKRFPFQNIKAFSMLTNEEREAMRINKSVSHKGQIPVNRIAVEQYTKQGDFVASFVSYKEASELTGVELANICRACRNERKSAGGYIWRKKG